MKMPLFARSKLVIFTLMSAACLSAGLAYAERVKEFDRSGRLVVTERSAAEQQPSYDIKNLPKEKVFEVPRPPFSEGDLPLQPVPQLHETKSATQGSDRVPHRDSASSC